jgi:hypothetical protein
MNHAAAIAGTLIWIGVNFFAWSWKQEQTVLFWESLALGAAMFPALFWYVKGAAK